MKIQIIHTLNGNLYEDEFNESVNEYGNLQSASYVLATDKDCAEDAIIEKGLWIGDLAVSEVINYAPEHELTLRLSDGSIYKEEIKVA